MKIDDTKNTPSTWTRAALGAVTEQKVAQRGPNGVKEFVYVDISSIDNESKKITDPKRIISADAPSRAKQNLRVGDVIVSMTRPNLNAVALVPPAFDESVGSTGFHVLRSNAVNPGWLYYAVQSRDFVRAMSQLVQGALYPAVRPKDIRGYEIPLPPPNEQRRIVAKIEELFSDLDAGVAALERVRANLKRYRAAVLNAAVTGRLTEAWRQQNSPAEPADRLLIRILHERRKKWEVDQLRKFAESGKNPPKNWQDRYVIPRSPKLDDLPKIPKGWCWVTLDQLIAYLHNGWSLKPEPNPPGHRLLRINAVRPMSVDMGEVRFVHRSLSEVENYFVESGDLLFTRYNGSVDLLGVCGMVRQHSEPTLHPDKLIRVCTVLSRPLNGYVEVAANISVSRKHMAGRARTTAGQTGISGTDIREMPIPLCPLSEQGVILGEVERRLSVVDVVGAEVEHGLKRAARLRQAILKRAFEGKLVPQIIDEAKSITTIPPVSAMMPRRRRASHTFKSPRFKRKHRQGIAFDRGAVLSHVIHRLSSSPSFGRTEAMKTLYIGEAWLGVDLELEPVREKLGPLDNAIYKIENLARKQGWFTTKKVGPMIRYEEGPNIHSRLTAAKRIIGNKLAEFDRLLNEIGNMDTEQAELFATTFAVWNDLLLDQRPVDDAGIIAEVHGWHPSKVEKFPAHRIILCVNWMKRESFVPQGTGPRSTILAA